MPPALRTASLRHIAAYTAKLSTLIAKVCMRAARELDVGFSRH